MENSNYCVIRNPHRIIYDEFVVPNISTILMLRTNLSFDQEDDNKYVLGCCYDWLDYPYFLVPFKNEGEISFWINGLDGKETFNESFHVFETIEQAHNHNKFYRRNTEIISELVIYQIQDFSFINSYSIHLMCFGL